MSYEVIKAEDREEALAKSGYVVGGTAIVTELIVSSADKNGFIVIPVVQPVPQEFANQMNELIDAISLWQTSKS